jgi:23S rRNA (guanosine2251-2'-O)-methyltransferase
MKTEVLYGIHPVREAIRAARRRIVDVALAPDKKSPRLESLRQAAEARGIPVRVLRTAEIAAMAGAESHQGAAARVSAFAGEGFDALLAHPQGPEMDFVLALDCVQDPHNLGAVLRTALCAGVQAVLAPRDRAAPPTPAVSRVSAGALEHTRFIQVTNMARSLALLKERGFWVAGLDSAASEPLYALDGTLPLVLVVGGEERGLRPLVRRACDRMVAIPQSGPLDSLNASAAAAVALYEIVRQRRFTDGTSRRIGTRRCG